MTIPPPLPWGTRTFVMGILNVTPDSFSGDGLLNLKTAGPREAVLEQAARFVAAGARQGPLRVHLPNARASPPAAAAAIRGFVAPTGSIRTI